MSQAASRGCLQAHEIEQVARAAPGTLAPELAGHLTTCAPCRRRLLALDIPDRAQRSPQVPLQQRVLRVLLVLALIVVALLTLVRLTKP